MSEEKKKEEKKKEKKTIVLDGYESVQTNLSQAMVAQGIILGSALARQVMESARIAEAMSNSLGTIKMMETINSVMRQQNAITQVLQNAMQNSAVIGTMAIYENQTRKLAEGIAAISQRIQSITPKVVVPLFTTELATIPRQTNVTVRTLENYIVALEEELVKEKTKNKELLAFLEDKRKELKKQYVV